MEPTNLEQQRWEHIDAYLRNELTAEQKQNFEKQLHEDSTMAQELEDIRTAGALVKDFGQRESLKAIHEKMVSSANQQQRTALTGTNFYLRVAAIIVFLVVAWAGIGLATLSTDSLYVDDYTAYVSESVRGESPEKPAVSHQLQMEYSNANYTRVVELYRQSQSKNLHESFIAGNAFLALNQPANAVTCFKRVLSLSAQENSFDYYQDAEYYLAWAYLKNNQFNESMRLFDKIYRSQFHTHNADVDAWFYWKLKLLQWKRG